MTLLNLSFAGAGFLGVYHMGALKAFLRHGPKLLDSLNACAGASAGALTAAVLVTAPDKLEMSKEFLYGMADRVRRRQFGGVIPGHGFMVTLRDCLEEILPSDAHRLANRRLHISITDLKSGKNQLVSRFASREELMMALLASCYVPVYAGMKPVKFQGRKCIDGGFTDNLPILPVGRTITVSPFAGQQDVCPVHRGRLDTHFTMANMSTMLSVDNMKRLHQSLFPPSALHIKAFHDEGFSDTVAFLKREAWMS